MSAVRVLHLVGAMNPGGIETWLLHVLRILDRQRFRVDFMVSTDQQSTYDSDLVSLGSRIIPCLGHRNPWSYGRKFRRILRDEGPYDIIHSHMAHFSGFALRLAHRAGVRVRIAHSHSDISADNARASLPRKLYLALMGRWLARYSTCGLAASGKAAASLYGPGWRSDPRWRLLYCGIDLTPFEQAPDPVAVRAELGLPAASFVLGHVGRFVEAKNHPFLVEIAAEVIRREPRARLLLVGDGPLRPAVERQVAEAGLTDHVLFAGGGRRDVPRLLLGAVDVFVMPSLYEGLPLGGLEAQAAGLPCVLSEAITPEVVHIPRLVQWLSLAQPASHWAEAVLAARQAKADTSQAEALALMRQSPFDIRASVRELEQLYERSLS
jgi:glycosyltransferase involved in cell wall biosynthesis